MYFHCFTCFGRRISLRKDDDSKKAVLRKGDLIRIPLTTSFLNQKFHITGEFFLSLTRLYTFLIFFLILFRFSNNYLVVFRTKSGLIQSRLKYGSFDSTSVVVALQVNLCFFKIPLVFLLAVIYSW